MLEWTLTPNLVKTTQKLYDQFRNKHKKRKTKTPQKLHKNIKLQKIEDVKNEIKENIKDDIKDEVKDEIIKNEDDIKSEISNEHDIKSETSNEDEHVN